MLLHSPAVKIRIVLAIVLSLVTPVASSAQNRPTLEVRVDPRVELAAVLCRLAGYSEYQVKGIPAYDREVEAHFRKFDGHPSVEVLRRLRKERGIGYNATVEAALAADPATWKPRISIDPWPDEMDDRWDAKSARSFMEAAARFERDTEAKTFFARHRALYDEVEANVAAGLVPRVDLEWYARQFGERSGASFVVVPALLNGPNSYGPHIKLPGGREEIFAVLATPEFGEGAKIEYPIDAITGLVVHELGHSHVNPWVDRHAKRLEPGAGKLFDAVAEKMRSEAYGTWRIMTYESLVRASTIRYFSDRGDAKAVARALEGDRATGFLWTDELADVLASGTTTPRLESAANRVYAFFDAWGREAPARLAAKKAAIDAEDAARRKRGPQIEALFPADGATVDSGATVLEIRFDRAMGKGVSIGGNVPEVTGTASWDEARRVLRVPVTLAPGTSYTMQLRDGFRSESGEPLYPRTWSFSTR